MTVSKALAGALDLHKKIVGAQNIHLRAAEGFMKLSSASAGGKALISRISSDARIESVCVDIGVLSSFVRGSGNLSLSLKEDRLIISGGKVKGDIPGLSEDSPKIEKTNGVTVPAADAEWLSSIVPLVAMAQLKNGSLAAACDGKEWRVSCTDKICGACAFGHGTSKIKFALVPTDALTLNAIIASTDKALTFGLSENRLVVSYPGFTAAIPTIHGVAQTKDVVVQGSKEVARIDGSELTEAIKAIAPFASVKDAAPVTMKLSPKGIQILATSSAGTMTQTLGGKCVTDASINLSFELLSGLTSKIGDEPVSIQVLREEKEITRLTLKTKHAYYLMLTSV